jgi:hypothetical protein
MGFSKYLFHGSKFAVDVAFLDTRFVISPKQKHQKRSFAENRSDSMVGSLSLRYCTWVDFLSASPQQDKIFDTCFAKARRKEKG